MNPSNIDEHLVLLDAYGEVQKRCTHLISSLTREIEGLQAELMRARGALIVRDSELATLRDDVAALKTAVPGLSKHMEMKRRLASQQHRIEHLQRERAALRPRDVRATALDAGRDDAEVQGNLRQKAILCVARRSGDALIAQQVVEMVGGQFLYHDGDDAEDSATLEESLVAADLVICQTGCIGHGAYWRVQDHCTRTGKRCVLVNEAEAVRGLRMQRHDTDAERAGGANSEAPGVANQTSQQPANPSNSG